MCNIKLKINKQGVRFMKFGSMQEAFFLIFFLIAILLMIGEWRWYHTLNLEAMLLHLEMALLFL